jgi:hypothetical protein
MSPFVVSSINDADIFRVMYGWKCNGKKGAFIRPAGYCGPKAGMPGYKEIKRRLYNLILGKEVKVGRIVGMKKNSMECDIFINGRNLLEYLSDLN